ncbi:MAG: ImmA/IrrE family metallo-endopeptidase [Methanobrevibacter thaueri]|nr:ImmA/IrrE family metallo-endopeptidase [Methanobrevibacter thaueri]
MKNISDKDIFKIKTKPEFHFKGKNQYNDFEEILSEDNLLKINNFKFTITDYSNIIQNIKLQALKNFDNTIKNNNINFDNLSILDKIILFAKSFTQINYKSSGAELGYFENNTIYIDDRQTQSLQITTLIHEISHFLLNEILACILSKILDSTKTRQTEIVINYILSYIPFAELIDEYCAHNVEGRFTVFGFQDYSSFLQIQKKLENEMTIDEIEIIKSIGNTLVIFIKDILESLIDESLCEEIKELFLKEIIDVPNYNALKMENCQILNSDGLIKSLWMILNDGCEVANSNIDTLRQIE